MMYAKLGLRNFWKQRRRNIFTVISVMLGTAGLISLQGYVNRWEHTGKNDSVYLRGAGTLSVYKKDGLRLAKRYPKKYTLNESEQNQIQALLKDDPQVEYLGRTLYMTGIASNGCESQPFEITGYDPILDKTLRSRPDVQLWCEDRVNYRRGKHFTDYKEANVVGVALGLAKLLNKKQTLAEGAVAPASLDLKAYCSSPDAKEQIGKDPNLQLMGMTFDGQFSAIDTEIGHLYSTGIALSDNTKMTAPLALLHELYQTQNVTLMAVYLRDHRHAAQKAKALEKRLRDQGLDVDVHHWEDERISPLHVGSMNFLYTMSFFFGLLVLAVVVLSVVNLTAMNVMERSREIGTLKALGYRRHSITLIFLGEAAITAAVGCLAGLLLSTGINWAVNSAGVRFLPPGVPDPILLILAPDPTVSSIVLGFIFLLVMTSSLITSQVLAKRSCLELLSRPSG